MGFDPSTWTISCGGLHQAIALGAVTQAGLTITPDFWVTASQLALPDGSKAQNGMETG